MAGKDFLERIARFSPKQLALLALELQQKVERLSSPIAEPIAIVGLACRFPGGVVTPEGYWRLLVEGVDAISEVPPERWDKEAYYDPNPDTPGKIATKWGGFLQDIDQFEPDFFGIAPREAVNMDPQQRLVLEVGWEALERAGYSPEALDRSRTGVFLGICNGDYFQLNASGDPRHIDAYLASGSAGSVASGRLSYLLGLRGPSVSIDTACSSSLVAIHLACQSLRAGESTMAIAGGVNAILRPEVTMTLSRAHMMSPDGRCKAFDSRADGFVRAEGCGLVVLKRLTDAQADGDTIFAVIRASAVNQDGRSSGLTAPNGPSQEAVIRDALAFAGLKPTDIDYVEAHGTGTSLGDPIEIQALGAALGAGRSPEAPLLVGSVKTNIGHLESAAGVAGLIKVILALRERTIPPHLHLREPNPHVDWSSLPVAIPTSSTPWPGRGIGRAGVSSFGFSGTNAHVILEEAPPRTSGATSENPGRSADAEIERRPYLLPIAARSESAAASLARLHAQHLGHCTDIDVADIVFTAGAGRAHFEHRVAVFAADRPLLVEKLDAAASGKEVPGVVRGRATSAPEIAFLFSGQGAQYVGMGRALYATEPVFRRVIAECEEALTGLLTTPLTRVLFESERADLERTVNLQPALFSLEVALAALWRSWGVTPTVVMGHSLGEFAAACVAGMFGAGDGARLVAHRGRLMEATRGVGRMVAVTTDDVTVRRFIASHGSDISIAAVNAPDQIVISGSAPAIDLMTRELAAAGIPVQALDVSHAFHSAQMDEMLASFETEARHIAYREPSVDIVSNVTGELYGAAGEKNDPAAYWRGHVRNPVLFARGMATLERRGCRVFVEIGPSPILVAMGRRCVSLTDAQWLPSLRRGRDEREQMSETAARLYVSGVNIDWAGFAGPGPHQRVPLPTYPFERQRYWITHPTGNTSALAPGRTSQVSGHPLAGVRLDTGTPTFETLLGLPQFPYLDSHRVGGRVVAPGALLLEMVRAAGALLIKAESIAVEDMRFREMLVVPESGSQRVHVAFHDVGESHAAFSIYSRPSDGSNELWIRHAEGRVSAPPATEAFIAEQLASVRSECTESMAPDDFYSRLAPLGLNFGAAFRGIHELWVGNKRILGRLLLPTGAAHDASTCAPYTVHPALLDSALQLVGVAVMRAGRDETYMQVSLGRMHLARTLPRELWGFAKLRDSTVDHDPVADVTLFDAEGRPVGMLEGVGLTRVPPRFLLGLSASANSDWLYEVCWRRDPRQRHPLTMAALGQQLRAALLPLSREHGLDAYGELSPRMERASAQFVARALRQTGLSLNVGERFTISDVRERCGIVPAFARLSVRMMAILAEEGALIERSAGEFEVKAALPLLDPIAECRQLLDRFPAFRAEIALLARCGEQLADVLQGKQDPLQLLFPGGDTAALEELYRNSPSAHAHNELVKRAVQGVIADGARRPFRVLEIGAGTGATTHHVLSALPAGAEYVFTDISPLFVSRAARTFAGRDSISFKVFDVDDKTLEEQGFTPHAFDMIVAANVLHATRDLRRTMSRVMELLRPGGVLVMLEGTRALRWVDLTFGMTEGWWRFTDRELRPHHALLTPSQWKALLETGGFTEIEAIPEGVEPSAQALVIARAGGSVQAWDNSVPDALVPEGARTGGIVRSEPAPQALRWVVCAETIEDARAVRVAAAAQGIECVLVARTGSDVSNRSRVLSEGGGPGASAGFRDGALPTVSSPTPRDREYQIAASDHLAAGRVLQDLRIAGIEPSVILFVATQSTAAAEGVEAAEADCVAAGAWLQATGTGQPASTLQAAGTTQGGQRLWVVTRGAQPVDGATPTNVAQAALWGWARVASLERPERMGGVVDVADSTLDPKANSELSLGHAIDAIIHARDEDQFGIRNGERFIPRLARTVLPAGGNWSCRDDRTYLVTGWMGGLGLLLVQWLVERGARHLVLVGRRDLIPGAAGTEKAEMAVNSARALGATVTMVRADVADAIAMTSLFARFGHDLPLLAGLFHVAADMTARPIENLDAAAYHSMLGPKAGGALLLDELSRSLELDCFVLFSSTTSLWGSQGLAHYAAANQVLDSLAHSRRARGLPALAVNWGTWDTMRLASAEQRAGFESAGLLPMAADEALDLLERLLADGATQSAVAAVDWDVLKAVYEARRPRPLFREIAALKRPVALAGGVGVAASDAWDLAEVADTQRGEWLIDRVRAEVAGVLGVDADAEVDLTRGLFEMGMDSLMAVELRARLEKGAGRTLPSTLTFNYPNVTALAGFIEREWAASVQAKGHAPDHAPEPTAPASTPAIKPAATSAASDNLDALTDDELEERLLARLSETR